MPALRPPLRCGRNPRLITKHATREGRLAITRLIQGPAPSLPDISRPADSIGRTAAEFARRSRAPATESAYASDWADFAAWCNSAERLALPADPVTIGAYLSDRSGILKVSTLTRRLAAIIAMRRLVGRGLDGKHPAIALVMAGIPPYIRHPPDRQAGALDRGFAPHRAQAARPHTWRLP